MVFKAQRTYQMVIRPDVRVEQCATVPRMVNGTNCWAPLDDDIERSRVTFYCIKRDEVL